MKNLKQEKYLFMSCFVSFCVLCNENVNDFLKDGNPIHKTAYEIQIEILDINDSPPSFVRALNIERFENVPVVIESSYIYLM